MASSLTDTHLDLPQPFVLRLNIRRVYFTLLSAIALLVVLSSIAKMVMLAFPADQYGAVNEVCKRFYLDFENNIPAWFSTLGLFVSSCLFGTISCVHRQREGSIGWRWLGLSLLFLLLAIDEATFMHEILIVALRNRLNLSGIFYFAWVIPGAIFVFTVVMIYLPFVLRLPKPIRNGLMTAGAIFVGGALGMELMGGYFAESQGFDAPAYVLVMTIEESMEMIGVATLIAVLLKYLAMLCPQTLEIQWHDARLPSA